MSFLKALQEQVLLFDGAMGTQIQNSNLGAKDFPNQMEGFNDGLVLTMPELIEGIHDSYLTAGADCIETNTFGGNRLKLSEYGFGDQTLEINKRAAELARIVCNNYHTNQKYVIGSMGPTGYLPSSNDSDLGQKSPDEIKDAFVPQCEGLLKGGVDALLIETSQDILEVKLAIEASFVAMLRTGKTVPVIGNVTLDQYGKMLLGTNVQAAYTTICDMGISVFGLNCSTGPNEMKPSIEWLNEQSDLPILIVPNAGMPENVNGKAIYKMNPAEMANVMNGFIRNYEFVRVIGGCCGTGPDHIHELRICLNQYQQEIGSFAS
ncbi:MAG TPA: homocysteine S-methyltransferase family protein [Nitrososphaeraceae archaeon]